MFKNKKISNELQDVANKSLAKYLVGIDESLKAIKDRLLEDSKYGKITFVKDNEFQSIISTSQIQYEKLENLENNLTNSIQKEIKYDKDLTKAQEQNPQLLEILNTYIDNKDKYEILEIFNKLVKDYSIDIKVKNKK